jgi:hypothetical protein
VNSFLTTLGSLLLFGLTVPQAAAQAPAQQPAQPAPNPTLTVPRDLIGETTLEQRKAQQQSALKNVDTFHGFTFTDRVQESGITFKSQIVDDVGRDYKMVHYDHGNGVLVADVDGDGLSDLYFITQVGANQLWRNLGKGRFENITDKAGVGLQERISVTGSFADYDNDGDPDLYVTTVKMGNVLFQNDGKGKFTDVTAKAGLEYVGHSSGVVFFDYDNDGLLDLFVTNVGVYTTAKRGRHGYYTGVDQAFGGHLFPERTEASILYRNLGGGRFEDVSKATGLVDTSWSGDAAFTDLNGDGFQDLYVVNMQGDDHFYLNEGGRRFVDQTAEHFPKTPWGTMGIEFFDYDNDGDMDLVLTDMHSDMTEQIQPDREKLKSRMQWSDETLQGGANNIFGNAFYINRGKGRFEEASDRLGTENYWPWGVSVGDLNADGWEDLFYTSSMNYPFRYGINSLLLNHKGEKFLDSEFVLGVEPRRDGALTTDWMDLDCSGEDRGHQHCRGREGKVTVRATLGSRSSVLFDADQDGDLDIVTNEFNSQPQVLISSLSQAKAIHFLKVRLVGTQSNRDGLGARVRVVAGDRAFTQIHDGKSGYLSQSSLPLYFGLGGAAKADRVEITWPSGARQVIDKEIPQNGLLEVVEPKSEKKATK